jgi:hypothetical protein
MYAPVKQRQDYVDLRYFLSMCLHEETTKALSLEMEEPGYTR